MSRAGVYPEHETATPPSDAELLGLTAFEHVAEIRAPPNRHRPAGRVVDPEATTVFVVLAGRSLKQSARGALGLPTTLPRPKPARSPPQQDLDFGGSPNELFVDPPPSD